MFMKNAIFLSIFVTSLFLCLQRRIFFPLLATSDFHRVTCVLVSFSSNSCSATAPGVVVVGADHINATGADGDSAERTDPLMWAPIRHASGDNSGSDWLLWLFDDVCFRHKQNHARRWSSRWAAACSSAVAVRASTALSAAEEEQRWSWRHHHGR